jgi:hypothetical protein
MLVCLLVIAATASARVVRLPPVVEYCGGELTSDEVLACTRKLGEAKVERTLPHARLVRVPGRDTSPSSPGYYVFVENHGHWHLAGIHEGDGELFGFDLAKLGTRTAYHFDLGVSEHIEISLDGVTPSRGLYVRREQVYCSGEGWRCSTAMTSCDLLVGGKAVETFRGKVEWKANQLHIAGDRSRAGNECDQAESVYF